MDRRRSSHIVPEIYEATIDPAHWDYVVTMIAKLTQSQYALLYYKNKDHEFASTIAQYGPPDRQELRFSDQYESLHHAGEKIQRRRGTQMRPVLPG